MLVITVDKSGVALNSTVSGVFTCKSRLDWRYDSPGSEPSVGDADLEKIFLSTPFGASYPTNSDSLPPWSDDVQAQPREALFRTTIRCQNSPRCEPKPRKNLWVTSKPTQEGPRSFREGIQRYLGSQFYAIHDGCIELY
jgi:hypothetical protein